MIRWKVRVSEHGVMVIVMQVSFKDGQFHGDGLFEWADGNKYIGEW